MDMSQLEALGFYSVAGNIDRAGINFGVLSKDGPMLSLEGESLARHLQATANSAAVSAETVVVEEVKVTDGG